MIINNDDNNVFLLIFFDETLNFVVRFEHHIENHLESKHEIFTIRKSNVIFKFQIILNFVVNFEHHIENHFESKIEIFTIRESNVVFKFQIILYSSIFQSSFDSLKIFVQFDSSIKNNSLHILHFSNIIFSIHFDIVARNFTSFATEFRRIDVIYQQRTMSKNESSMSYTHNQKQFVKHDVDDIDVIFFIKRCNVLIVVHNVSILQNESFMNIIDKSRKI